MGFLIAVALRWSMTLAKRTLIAEPALWWLQSLMAKELVGTRVTPLVHRTRLADQSERFPLAQVQRELAEVKEVRTASLLTAP